MDVAAASVEEAMPEPTPREAIEWLIWMGTPWHGRAPSRQGITGFDFVHILHSFMTNARIRL